MNHTLPFTSQIEAPALVESLRMLYPDVDWQSVSFWEVDENGSQTKKLTSVAVVASGSLMPREKPKPDIAFDDEIDRAIEASGIDIEDDDDDF